MTTEELSQISPAELKSLTDEELTARLAPLIPLARSAYIGPKTATVSVGEKKLSKAEFYKRQRILDSMMALAKGNVNENT